MSILSKLKLSDQTRAEAIADPIVRKRAKLVENIERQIKAAEAYLKGETYTFKADRVVRNAETGERTRQRVSVGVRQWWWKDMSGTYFLTVKYGNKKLELAKGKHSIEIGEQKRLLPVLQEILGAANQGEFDNLVQAAKSSTK